MTLSKQLPIGLFIFGFIMVSATYVMLAKSDQLLKGYTLTGLEREVQLLTNLVERTLHELYHNATVFPLVLGDIEDEKALSYEVTDPDFLSSLNKLVKNYKVYRRIVIVDTKGNVIAENSRNFLGRTISSANLTSNNIKHSSWFTSVSKHDGVDNDVFFYGPSSQIIDNSDKQYDLLIGSRISASDGSVVGYWLNIMDFGIVEQSFIDTYQLLADKGLPYIELTLLNENGDVIVDYDPIHQKSADYVRDFSVLGRLNLVNENVEGAKRAVAGLSGSVVSTHARKQVEQFTAYSHFSSYSDLPNLGWSTMIRVDQDIAYNDYLKLKRWYLWIFLVAFLIITAMSYLALKYFTEPLKKLTRVIIELSEGNVEPEIERTNRSDEVSSINNALITLKSKLKERKVLIEETQEQQRLVELQKKAMNSMNLGIVITDASSRDLPIIHVNKAVELLTGYRSEELINKNFRYLWGEETENISSQIIEDSIDKKEGCTCVITNYKKNRTTFINNLSVDPVFDNSGNLTHFIFVYNDITEIKKDDEIARFALERKIDESVRESKETAKRLRTVFDTALDGSVVMNQDGLIVDVNHSLEVIFGRNKSELVGKNVSVLMTNEHALHHDQYIKNYFQDGIKKFIGELRTISALHKSGRVIPIEISIGETKLENETIFVAAIRDISEQQEFKQQQLKLQDKLKERETIYRTAFNQAAVGIARVSIEGDILEVNQLLCQNLGYTEEELLQLNVEDITYEDDIEISRKYLKNLAEGKQKLYSLDKRYIRKDRTVFWANLGMSLVESDDDKAKYYISIIEDITERKLFEQELRDAKDQRDELIGGINLASRAGGICNWSYNMVTDELKWDPGTYTLFGVQQGEVLTYSDWRERVIPADIDRLEEEINNAIRKDIPLESEFRFTQKGHTDIRWAKVALGVTRDSSGDPVKMFGINIDITEQKRITSELEKETIAAQKANEAKSAFLATMSHEIRTPMNGVIGMIDLLKKTALNADQKRMASTIRDSSYALLEIINDILDFSKIEAGQVELEWSSTSILSIVEKTVGSLCVNAHSKNVDLVIEHDIDMPQKMLVDSMRLGQILLNLIGNAVKFSHYADKIGVVRIVSRFNRSSSELTIIVIDNGIGISKSKLDTLFKPFSQADSSTTRKYGGTGLGLSISKSFTELMGGEIWVKSEIAKGSHFYVRLPIPEMGDMTTDFEPNTFSGYTFYIYLEKTHFSNSCNALLTSLGAADVIVIDPDEPLVNKQKKDLSKSVLICESRTRPQAELQSLLRLEIDDDPIRKKGYITPYLYVVNGLPLKPSELILGLKVLCGLESPDFKWPEEDAEFDDSSIHEVPIFEGKKVLVVEDHPTNQMVIGRQLECLGVEYSMTDDGVEGLAAWNKNKFDLVLTDCHMPNMDGFEMTKRIRDIEALQDKPTIPIIAITANALVGEAETCLSAGMSDYLAKPVEVERLKNMLAKWLEDSSQAISTDTAQDTDMVTDSNKAEGGIDLQALISVIGTDDSEIVKEILVMFWESIQAEFAELERVLAAGNSAKIKSLAHASKGSSASSGAKELGELFRSIEANSDNEELVQDKISLIRLELVTIENQLSELGVIQA